MNIRYRVTLSAEERARLLEYGSKTERALCVG